MGLDDNGYYSLREILGYNCKYNIVLSDRGRGKSWGCKHFLMNQPGRFMCLYRTQPDMSMAIHDWIDPLVQSGHSEFGQFEWVGNDKQGWELHHNGSVKGYFRYLTQVNHIKQEVFPDDLDWVWFDEFIPLAWKKLGGIDSEGDAIRAIVKTIEHDTVHTREEKGLRPVRVLMFANPFTWNNPILSYFKVTPRYGIHRVGPGIVCELLPPYEAPKKDNRMTTDEFLGDEVNRNQGWLDQMAFVGPVGKGAEPVMSIRAGGFHFHMYQRESRRWIRKATRHHEGVEWRWGVLDGLTPDEECLEKHPYVKVLQQACYKGQLTFEDVNTKFDFINTLTSLR